MLLCCQPSQDRARDSREEEVEERRGEEWVGARRWEVGLGRKEGRVVEVKNSSYLVIKIISYFAFCHTQLYL